MKRVEATFAIVPVDVSLRSGRYQQNKISRTFGSNVKMNWESVVWSVRTGRTSSKTFVFCGTGEQFQ